MSDKSGVSGKLADDNCTIEESSHASKADGDTVPVPHVKAERTDNLVKSLLIFCVVLLSSLIFFSVYHSLKLNHKEEELEVLKNTYYILTNNRDLLETQAIQQSECERNNSDLQEILDDINSECDAKHSYLQEMIDNLKSRCGTDVSDLQEKLNNVKSECKKYYIALQKSYDTLQSKYTILKEEYDKLSKEFNDLIEFYCDATNTSPENICSFCKLNWVLFDSKCYFISSNQLSWKESQDWCKTKDGRLVNIESLEERDFLKSKAGIFRNKERFFWTERYDVSKENTTTMMDAGPVKSDRASDDDKEECFGMQLGLNKVLSNNCEVPYHWICESAPFLVPI